jgi:hypothetical protein
VIRGALVLLLASAVFLLALAHPGAVAYGAFTGSTATQTSSVQAESEFPARESAGPVISGTVQQGRILSTTTGTWTGTGVSYSYQWEQCNAAGEACTSIPGATASGYTVLAGDVGHAIRVIVTATNTGGAVAATSPSSGSVLIEAPVATVLPSISGSAIEGQTLTAENGRYKGNQIGRITPEGVITQFSTGITAGSEPYGIDAGTDGNLWFTEYKGNQIGRITPAGVITEFSTGITAGSEPYGIVAGSDGNLWFTEYKGNQIGRITPAGVITQFSTGLTAGSEPYGIVAGSDGNLWFTEYGGYRIGRLAIGGPVNTAAPVLTGTAQQGQTLSLSTGSWTGTPAPTYGYGWQRCNSAGEACEVISGASASTYTLVTADVGKTIRGVTTATNTLGVTPAPSAQTSTVL